jgi:hypothetical protein
MKVNQLRFSAGLTRPNREKGDRREAVFLFSFVDLQMSAIGPKRTWAVAPHMSAFRGKADMTLT